MSRSILEPDASEARGDQQLGDVAFLTDPSKKAGDACPRSGVGEWLLELGAATRQADLRSQHDEGQGHRLRAWSSRRARRRVVRQALACTMAGATEVPTPLAADPVAVEAIRQEPARPGAIEIPFEKPRPGPEPSAAETDPSRDDTVEVPAIEVQAVVLPPVEPEFADEPIFVRLPPVQAESDDPELIGEPELSERELAEKPVPVAWSGGDMSGECRSSLLLDRIGAYTLGPSTRVG